MSGTYTETPPLIKAVHEGDMILLLVKKSVQR